LAHCYLASALDIGTWGRGMKRAFLAVFFTFLEKSAIPTTAEIATNIGRSDLIAEMPQVIYIFELKLDKTATIAFDQVEAKKYKEKFSQNEKNILVMEINFSSKSRNIGDWKGALFSSDGKRVKEVRPYKRRTSPLPPFPTINVG